MLDMVAEEPLLLTYEPGEIRIPGTDEPLLLSPMDSDAFPGAYLEALD